MHNEILSSEQNELLPVLAKFKREFYLAGGTAIALHIGHRLSIDFDMFKPGKLNEKRILEKLRSEKENVVVNLNRDGQLNLIYRQVNITFLEYDFPVVATVSFDKILRLPSLLDLAAMKAYALGRRSKWKDYVDLYFILKDHYSPREISIRAIEIFGDLFSEKLFRGQLSYFVGISFEEVIDYMPGFEIEENYVKDYLVNAALES